METTTELEWSEAANKADGNLETNKDEDED
jgi:hypothetical protein